MPPQQQLAFGLRGFICRSCSSKLPHARRQWLSSRSKGQKGPQMEEEDMVEGMSSLDAPLDPETEPSARGNNRVKRRKGPRIPKDAFDQIKLFEQGPDGSRVEVFEDEDDIPKDADLRTSMQKKIDDLEAKTGFTIEELADGAELDQDEGTEEEESRYFDAEEQSQFAEMDRENDRLQAVIDRVGDYSKFEKMSAEDQERLRADVRAILHEELPAIKLTLPKHPQEEEFEKTERQIDEAEDADKSTRQKLDIDDFDEDYHTHIENLQTALDQFDVSRAPQSLRNRGRRSAKVAKVANDDRVKLLARFYSLARAALLDEPDEVPMAVWSHLWTAFSTENRPNPDRTALIKRLGEDMDEIEAPLSPSQRMLYIECVLRERLPERALELWEKAQDISEAVGNDYWALGVRLLSQLGHTQRAFDAAAFLFRDGKKPYQFRALIPLIESCLASRSQISVQRAWALYVRVKANLGHEMNLEDYDAVISSFLNVEEPELALAVFRDMMLTGDRSMSSRDATSLQKLYSGGDLSSLDFGQKELDWRDSRLISHLPPKFHNKFFYGSWVKKLIGDGQLKEAKQVLDLMQDHGIQPSPIQMNGLIGAWFRLGTASSWKMANDLAWRMIDRRAELMAWRDWKFDLQAPLRPQLSPESKPAFIKRSETFPPATLETFVLLVREYRQLQKHAQLLDLFEEFRKSRIVPNTQFMNQLLLLDLKMKQKTWAWDTYSSMTTNHGLKPNIQTFTVLWNMEKRTVDLINGPRQKIHLHNFPRPRELFAEIAKHKSAILKEGKLTRELYDLIVLTFSLASDQIGTAVALKVFHKHFDALPSEETARTILLQLTRMGLTNEAGIKPRRLDLGKAATQQRLGAVAQVTAMFRERRIEALKEKGIVFEKLSPEAQREESTHMLSDLLRYAASQTMSNTSVVERAQSVAEQMGFPDCNPWGAQPTPQNV